MQVKAHVPLFRHDMIVHGKQLTNGWSQQINFILIHIF